MTKETLGNRVKNILLRKRNIGLREREKTGKTNQLPVYLVTFAVLVEDSELPKDSERVDYVSAIAATLGMVPIEGEHGSVAWDVPPENAPAQLRESKIEVKYKPIIHIPGSTRIRGMGYGPDGMYDDPTYNLDDA
ncbi:MAG: hypothetical protein WCG44_00645 [bacterium]